ncbi:Mitochondrial import receptor subunit [Lachnellula hyalina]|uniref:Mitochondrial import receptor subunit n=1 Tax=Lachnellula hyalina TaxID=1316788 RepID=A0A8H8R0D9_9HELO|nr:Mitochondrial import receptor subunit [Lachnellula hyalina]TVY25771.1 Mitochondrial import receptor subunit [Lachnellula hyalina]
MVELVEVEDESFENKQAGPEYDDDDYSDTDSEISTDDEDEVPEEETLADRLLALRDIIPPTTRTYISNTVETTTSWVKSGLLLSGKTLWIVSTSALLLGVPYALAFAEEQGVMDYENEQKAREQGASVFNADPAATGQLGQLNAQLNGQAKPAL